MTEPRTVIPCKVKRSVTATWNPALVVGTWRGKAGFQLALARARLAGMTKTGNGC